MNLLLIVISPDHKRTNKTNVTRRIFTLKLKIHSQSFLFKQREKCKQNEINNNKMQNEKRKNREKIKTSATTFFLHCKLVCPHKKKSN